MVVAIIWPGVVEEVSGVVGEVEPASGKSSSDQTAQVLLMLSIMMSATGTERLKVSRLPSRSFTEFQSRNRQTRDGEGAMRCEGRRRGEEYSRLGYRVEGRKEEKTMELRAVWMCESRGTRKSPQQNKSLLLLLLLSLSLLLVVRYCCR